jgi:hypothetical protein
MASENGFFTLPLTSIRGEKIDWRTFMKAAFLKSVRQQQKERLDIHHNKE